MSDPTPTDLDVRDPAEWQHICNMQQESADVEGGPTLTVRCKLCRAKLAYAGTVPSGYLWAATWSEVAAPGDFEVVRNGKRLLPLEAAKESGFSRELVEGRDGYFAALLPSKPGAPVVPLYVNCHRHGDTLVAREDAIAAIREGRREMAVTPTMPRIGYRPQRDDGLADSPTRTETYTSTLTMGEFLGVEYSKAIGERHTNANEAPETRGAL